MVMTRPRREGELTTSWKAVRSSAEAGYVVLSTELLIIIIIFGGGLTSDSGLHFEVIAKCID